MNRRLRYVFRNPLSDALARDSVPKLRSHFLARFQSRAAAGDETKYRREEWSDISIEPNRTYPHATVALNFTTYDIRRGQDMLHVTHQMRGGKLAGKIS